jgi:multidrug resistance efflux pump
MRAENFVYLLRDVKRQRELAQKALAEAKRIDEILKANPENREELETARNKWLEMARDLAENANATSTTASTSISTGFLSNSK